MKISKVVMGSRSDTSESVIKKPEVNYAEIIDTLTTSSKVAEYFRGRGKNIIPIVAGTKSPPEGFPLKSYFDKKCDYPITDDMSIAILHGKISNTFAIDIDMKDGGGWEDAVHIIAKDIEKILSSTIVIKTPKQGCHFIVEPVGDFPPKNAKYFNKDGIEIDIKTQGGYTLLPPSTYPEKHLGKYQFISTTLKTNPTKWEAFEAHIASKGFFLKEDLDRQDELKTDYNLDKLLLGKFIRGSRRKSLNSLYCKMRVRRWSEKLCIKKLQDINRKLLEPLEEKELSYIIQYAESFFTHTILPSLDDYDPNYNKNKKEENNKKPSKNKPRKFSPYDGVDNLLDEYDFISHVTGDIFYYINGIYSKNGNLLIAKKCRQYWEVLGIDTTMINEITNIIKDKTVVLSESDNEEIFDTDYKKIILKNGMFDLDKMELMEYDPKVLSTIKHPIWYDSDKDCPKFDKFISSCFNGDKIRISQIWEMMALCFIKKYIIQKAYVNYGIGSNGKSTFLSILRNMIGINNITSIPMQQFQNSQFIGYELRGKCANISADGGTEQITKTGFLKGVLGGDSIRCEQKFRNPFDFMPFVTMIFTFNELPVVTDASDGFARKIQTIHWDVNFYGKDRKHEVDQLAFDGEERSGIFNRLLPIIKRLIDTRKLEYESSVDETKVIWLSRSDSFYRFKKEYIVVGTDYQISPNHIDSAYAQFCEEERITPIPKNILFEKLKSINGTKPSNTRENGELVRVWRGFTLKSQLKDKEQSHLD